jgi:hypothetical protein
VQAHSRVAGQPGANRRVLVGGQLVDHEMPFAARAGGGDLLEEGRELLVAVPLGAGLADTAGDDLQHGNSVVVPRRTQSKQAVFGCSGRTGRVGAARWSARIHDFSSPAFRS